MTELEHNAIRDAPKSINLDGKQVDRGMKIFIE